MAFLEYEKFYILQIWKILIFAKIGPILAPLETPEVLGGTKKWSEVLREAANIPPEHIFGLHLFLARYVEQYVEKNNGI